MTPTDIQPLDPAAVRILEDADKLAAVAQRRANIYASIRAIAIQATDISDWRMMGEHCYLEEGGVKKVARVCGVSMGAPRQTKQALEPDERHGTGYLWRTEAEFCVGKLEESTDIITEIGVATSRDAFFAETGRGDDKVYLSSWEVDEANIIKKSHTNCFSRGVTSLLGIRNVTPDQLKAAGLDVTRLKGIRFDSGSKGGRGQQESASTSAADLEVTAEKRKKLRDQILEMCQGDQADAKTMLAALTKFTGRDGKEVAGVQSVDRLSGQRLDIALDRVTKEHDTWAAEHPTTQKELPE